MKDIETGKRAIYFYDPEDEKESGWIEFGYNFPLAEEFYLRKEEHTDEDQVNWRDIELQMIS